MSNSTKTVNWQWILASYSLTLVKLFYKIRIEWSVDYVVHEAVDVEKTELLRTITDIIGDAENYCFSNPGFSNSDKSIKD